jgi:general secretion pathway protein D
MRPAFFAAFAFFAATLAGCALMPQSRDSARMPGSGHLLAQENPGHHPTAHEEQAAGSDPASLRIQPPAPTYSLDARLAPVDQVLTALARDQRIDLELHPGVEGLVSLSVFNRTLPELIESLCDQAGLRCEFDGRRLVAMPDTPFMRAYRIDYVNLERDMNGTIATSTQITTSNSAVDANGNSGGGNASLTQITARATNHFWETLESNIRALLKEHERSIRKPRCEATRQRKSLAGAEGDSACGGGADDPASVVSNREAGVLMVLANGSQHRKVAEFIDLVQGAARRQVMVEATIVEVTLADGYRQGIDWNRLGVPILPGSSHLSSNLTPSYQASFQFSYARPRPTPVPPFAALVTTWSP